MKVVLLLSAYIVAASALSVHQQWASFKKNYQRVYNLKEEQLRFQIFRQNLRKILDHNLKYEKGEVNYFLKITKFADRTDEEYNAILNPKIAEHSQKRVTKMFVTDPNFIAPSSVDWRDEAVLAVKDQKECGACWAFSSTGALEGQLAIHKNQRIPLSEQELIDCDTNNSGCRGGNSDIAFEYIQENGLSSESQYEYMEAVGECKKVYNKTVTGISDWLGVPADEDALKAAVAKFGPISISVFSNADWSAYGGGILDTECNGYPNHSVLAVGYTEKYWIVKNSWGPAWGEDGYIRLAMAINQCNITFQSQVPIL